MEKKGSDSMGHAKKRVQPAITSRVNRNIDELVVKLLIKLINKGPEPWRVDPRGNPHPPKPNHTYYQRKTAQPNLKEALNEN